jgi:hypothetical protein
MNEASMSDSSRLSLIPAFYLSKFDKRAVAALGYKGFTDAFNDIGRILGLSSSSIKNKRDDFDPIHDNKRAGWHQRPLGPSRAKVVVLLDSLSFDALTSFVKDLLLREDYRSSDEVEQVLASLRASETQKTSVFVPRGYTGRRAEQMFIEEFQSGNLPFTGELVDRREDGCGYDFLIHGAGETAVEVKGLAGGDGGILLTDKEWQTAKAHPQYKLFLAYNLDTEACWKIIDNPYGVLDPARQVRTIVQVSWQVGPNQLCLVP